MATICGIICLRLETEYKKERVAAARDKSGDKESVVKSNFSQDSIPEGSHSCCGASVVSMYQFIAIEKYATFATLSYRGALQRLPACSSAR